MAQLTYNSINKFRYYGQESEEGGTVSQEESMRDKLLREILSSHLKTEFKIENCIKNKDKFVAAAKQEGFSKCSRGLMSNESFKSLCKSIDLKEILLSCNLEAHEIDILLDENSKYGKGTEEAFKERLESIQQKLEIRQTYLEEAPQEHYSGAVKLNRHQYEEECNKMCSSEAEKLTSCLVQLEPYSDPSIPVDHPINKLAEIEKQLFPHAENKLSDKKKTKKRRLNKCDYESSSSIYLTKRPNTFWDMKDRPIIVPNEKKTEHHINYKDANPLQFVNETDSCNIDYSKAFVWSLKSSELLSISFIENNRQTISQIKENPKFNNYTPGTPSSTLYIKNLPHNVSPISLVALFRNFEDENNSKIEYRILKGKMKGQAFVKFKSEQIAVKALQCCNGFVLDGKPIVIEFGRRPH